MSDMVSIADKPAPSILPEIFAPVKSKGSFYAIKPYPQSAAILEVLGRLLEEWKITPYRLSKLLGMNSSALPGQWMRGEKKPSPYYCCLLLRLLEAVLFDKLNITLVDSIDWKAGEIVYKGRGNAKHQNGVPSGQRPGSQNQGRNGSAMAQFYPESY